MSNITLYDYQNTGVSLLRNAMSQGKKKLVLVAPTGAGKTIIFSYMAMNAIKKQKRVLIVSDRDELLKQSGGALEGFNMKPIIISRSNQLKTLNGMLYVGMVETLARRLKDEKYKTFINNLDLIIFDEAHKQSFNKIFPFITGEKTFVIGATATPYRDKNMVSMDDFYEHMEEVAKVSQLIELGYLCKPKSFGVPVDLSNVKMKGDDYDGTAMGDMYNEIKLYEGVYDNYQKITPGKKALIFASNIDSSKNLVNDFVEKGLPCKHLDSNMTTKEREDILEWFKNTDYALLSNVGILNTGFDCKTIEVVILYRATKSLPLFLQMVGRGSRTIKGVKDTFYILDFGNNIKTHGFWQQDRVWSLAKKKKKKTEGMAPVKECPVCGYINPIQAKTCEDCDTQFIVKLTEKEKVFIELQEMSPGQIKELALNANFETLENIQQAKGYSKGWIYHQLKTEEDLRKYAKHKGYKDRWVKFQLNNRK